MNVIPENLDSWFNSLADEALIKNNKSVCTWNKYKDDLKETKKILSWLPSKLKHDVMVPIGPKALMRGKIVHTNEFLVNLGETWFVKRTASQTIDICDRRIKECDGALERLKKERELLENKKSLPAEKEAFGSEERPEIIEYVTEEDHQEWKKQHRMKEKEYRQKLAEIRNKEKKPIETEEDLWSRLDELELREELEDELCRLNAEDEDNSEESEDISESCEIVKSDENDNSSNVTSTNKSCSEENNLIEKSQIKSKNLKVNFADDPHESDHSSENEPLILEIKHSSVEPVLVPFNGFINSPGDIYHDYIKSLSIKSILKKRKNIDKEPEIEVLKNEPDGDINISPGILLPDIIAKNVAGTEDESPVIEKNISFKEPTRKMSKFKASRMRKS